MSQRGILLAFEGVDGSGKSTQARRVAHDRNALFTFEPGASALGAQLRTWLLDAATPMTPTTEALLMLADRAHHVATVIEPALAAGHDVVTDRFVGSTLAYQGYGRGVDLRALEVVTALAVGDCRATLTVLIDVPVEIAHARRGVDMTDRFESSSDRFHEAVRQGYLELARKRGESWIIIDGSLDEGSVSRAIDESVAALAWSTSG